MDPGLDTGLVAVNAESKRPMYNYIYEGDQTKDICLEMRSFGNVKYIWKVSNHSFGKYKWVSQKERETVLVTKQKLNLFANIFFAKNVIFCEMRVSVETGLDNVPGSVNGKRKDPIWEEPKLG